MVSVDSLSVELEPVSLAAWRSGVLGADAGAVVSIVTERFELAVEMFPAVSV